MTGRKPENVPAPAARKAAAKRPASKSTRARKTVAKSRTHARAKPAAKAPRGKAKPTLLAGGNPQIAKADGDLPVQAYLAAMPGWKVLLALGTIK